MGLTHSSWTESSSNQLRADFRPDTPQTHNALDDAKAQASIFAKMLAFARKR
jgi:beta-galactosidase GanA